MKRMINCSTLLISCLAFLSFARCSTIKHVVIPEKTSWTCRQIPLDSFVTYGSGAKSIYTPSYISKNRTHDEVQTSSEPFYIDLISSSGDHCKLQVDAEDMLVPDYDVHQSSPTTLYVIRRFYPSKGIVVVDMKTCTSKKVGRNVNGTRNIDFNARRHLIQFENGFAVFIPGNVSTWTGYDNDGNQTGKPSIFLYEDMAINYLMPISPNSHNSSVIVDYVDKSCLKYKQSVSILNGNGRLIKHLLKFNRSRAIIADEVSDSLYTGCYELEDDGEVECRQFDEFGNEKFRNSTRYLGRPIAVSNLKKGGLVLFTATNTEVHVIEMRPGKIDKSSYPVPRYSTEKIFVAGIDEVNHLFTVLLDDIEYKQPCWNTFSLSSRYE